MITELIRNQEEAVIANEAKIWMKEKGHEDNDLNFEFALSILSCQLAVEGRNKESQIAFRIMQRLTMKRKSVFDDMFQT